MNLDDVLFTRRGWFALGPSNERVAGVVVPSLRDGLELIGEGSVRAVVGRLRPEVRVVDVDLSGPRGDAATEAVSAWCRERETWHLVRPSGGGPGRHHIFVGLGAGEEGREVLVELEQHLCQLRAQMHCARPGIDLRDAVRPLSSPHRNGTTTRVYGSASTALMRLRGHTWAEQTSTGHQRRDHRRGPVAPSVPLRHRTRRDLPAQWRAYLEHGVRPLIRVDAAESRSNYEATATAALLRCGYSADEAWRAIGEAHREAFTKARAQGRSWWVRAVWNPAVRSDDAFAAQPRHGHDVALEAAVTSARAALERLAWSLPTRRRPALLLVGHTVLDRVLRSRGRRVPVPERDLVLDTGLRDRKTIRSALRSLNGPVGALHTETWDPTKRDSSSFEFEIPEVGVLSQSPPPSLHTPYPSGIWSALPRLCHQLWRALASTESASSVGDLAGLALVTDTPDADPTPRQSRTVLAALKALAEVGLAACSAEGRWVASRRVAAQFAERVATGHARLEEEIRCERQVYRARSASEWSLARAAAMKSQRAREVAWWNGLHPLERDRRRRRLEREFVSLSVLDQERLKAALADRRRRHGLDEAARYRSWIWNLTDEELTARSAARAASFLGQPAPVQRALADSWARHRSRYGLPRLSSVTTRIEHRELLPVGEMTRDREHWLQEVLVDPAATVHEA